MPPQAATPTRSRESRRRLRTRRGLLFTALPVILLIAAVGALLAISHRNTAAKDRRDEVQAVADAAASNADRFTSDQFTLLQTIGLSNSVREGDYDRIRPFLRRITERAAFSTSLFFVDREARIQATRQSDGVSLADRAYIRRALQGRPAVSEVVAARVSGQPTVVFAHPVRGEDGQVIGAVAGNLRLNEVTAALSRLFYAPGADEYLMDDEGHLIIGTRPVRDLVDPPAAVRLRGREGTTVGEIDGAKRLIAYAPVPRTGWTAAVAVDYGDTLGQLNTALGLELFALGLLGVLGVLVVLSIGRRLERVELERDAALDQQSLIAAQLQDSMLPQLPRPAGVDLVARYEPAQSDLAVGGDWYDVVDVGDGRVAASIGDVAGHGLQSAAAMGQLRSAIRSLSLSGRLPGESLTELDRFTTLIDGRPLATVVQILLDTRDGTLRYACAGHPAPLLLRADGTTEYLHDGRSPLLGIAPGEARDEGVAQLEPGDALLIYTDGLIERPDSTIDAGLTRLQELAGRVGPEPEALARELLATVPEPRRDDVALLCVRLTGAPVAQSSVPS